METSFGHRLRAKHPLPDATRLGSVALFASDVEAMLPFYTGVIGLELLGKSPQGASLGAGGAEILRLVAKPGSKHYGHKTGLYHFCIATPQREDFALLLRRVLDSGLPLQGLVDHHVAEAIYLADTEGNGIELNWDRPREAWGDAFGKMAMGNGPLDAEGLLALADETGAKDGKLPPDAWLSHMHLHVKDLASSRRFYHESLGLDIMGEFPRAAVFTSAGGYHHHVAFNIWNGVGAPEPPSDASGLDWFSLLLPDAASLEALLGRLRGAGLRPEKTGDGWLLRDPSGNGVVLKA